MSRSKLHAMAKRHAVIRSSIALCDTLLAGNEAGRYRDVCTYYDAVTSRSNPTPLTDKSDRVQESMTKSVSSSRHRSCSCVSYIIVISPVQPTRMSLPVDRMTALYTVLKTLSGLPGCPT